MGANIDKMEHDYGDRLRYKEGENIYQGSRGSNPLEASQLWYGENPLFLRKTTTWSTLDFRQVTFTIPYRATKRTATSLSWYGKTVKRLALVLQQVAVERSMSWQ